MTYVYFTGNKEYTSIDDYINPFHNLKENLTGNTDYYKGVLFYSYNHDRQEDFYSSEKAKDDTMEGFVDKRGNLVGKTN